MKKGKHGGSRKGSGRKKGTGYGGISSVVKKYVDEMMIEMAKDDRLKKSIQKDIKQLSITSGWIYIIKDETNNEIKIGVTQSNNPNNRLSLYTVHKMNIELIYIQNIEDCFDIEEIIHDKYNEKRVKGDWFNLSDLDVLNVIKIINNNQHNKIYNGRR